MVKPVTDQPTDTQSATSNKPKPARKAETKVAAKVAGTAPAPHKAAGPKKAGPKAAGSKAAGPKVAAAKPPKAPKPAVSNTAPASQKTGQKQKSVIRKKDFVERILEAAGSVNKAQAKLVVDHVLAELAAAIHKGESLILPPLGKLRVTARTQKDGVPHSMIKVKGLPNEGEKTAKPPLAETAD